LHRSAHVSLVVFPNRGPLHDSLFSSQQLLPPLLDVLELLELLEVPPGLLVPTPDVQLACAPPLVNPEQAEQPEQ
jgi:hypothetical protein